MGSDAAASVTPDPSWLTVVPRVPNVSSRMPAVVKRDSANAGAPNSSVALLATTTLPSGWTLTPIPFEVGNGPRPTCVTTLPPNPNELSRAPFER